MMHSKDKCTILYRGLLPYVFNGPNNSTTNALTDAEIDAITSADLIARIRDFFSYPHEIMYFGPRSAKEVAQVISKKHRAPTTLRPAPPLPPWQTRPLDRPEVLVVHHDMVQAEVFLYGRSLPRYDTTLLHTLPEVPSSLENARSSVKQSIASDRIVRNEILWNYITARHFGYTTDQRRGTYSAIDTLTMSDVQQFYSKAVKDRCKVIAILADTSKIDMKALEKYGPVRVVKKSELFPYSE
ncbi:MAG: hypothetical protein IPP80_08415 [Ignavibacteria bacterium]|nr:hypothetical protein [Ignavibacteria bacterium]